MSSSRKRPRTTPVRVGNITIGGPEFVLIAGPCSVETRARFLRTAQAVKAAGATLLRGGLFKLRTDPRSFQGLGLKALSIAQAVKQVTGLGLVSEVTDPRHIEPLLGTVDMFQVGARSMHSYALLKELSLHRTPVLLKRGLSALIDEWLLAAEYIAGPGRAPVILCERGIRTFETRTRNTLDLSAVAYAKLHAPYPVLVDPSHGTGVPALVAPLSLAAAAVGADGLLIEVHDDPAHALSDGDQALTPRELVALVARLSPVLEALSRPLLRRAETAESHALVD